MRQMTVDPEITKYCDLMQEVKNRMKVIDFFLFGGGHAIFEPTSLESTGLQFRKILELIAFGSLVANKEIYAVEHERFATHWHANRLLRDLGAVNPAFYPQPVNEIPSTDVGIKAKLENRQLDYLTKVEFEEVYDKCGALMHAANPYGTPTDFSFYKGAFPAWRQKIINLLNSHQVHLLNDPGFFLLHMNDGGADVARAYRFKPPSALN